MSAARAESKRNLKEPLDRLEVLLRAEDARVHAVANEDVAEFSSESPTLPFAAKSPAQRLGLDVESSLVRCL